MSTLRLRFGEPVRFRFLVGMLSSGAGSSSPQLQSIGLRFVNTFLEAAPAPQIRLYIQAELEQAGLQPSTIRKVRTISTHKNYECFQEKKTLKAFFCLKCYFYYIKLQG